MPKKSAGASSSRKVPPSASNDEGSYIVFGHGPPGKEKPAGTLAGSGVKGYENQNNQDQVKKPDTRQLIGGPSWTGKLPMNLLSEHCQKQKWEKPEYTMVHGRYDALIVAYLNLTLFAAQVLRGFLIDCYIEGY